MPLTATAAAGLVVPLVLTGEPRGALFEGDCARPGADTRLADLRRVAREPTRPIVLSTGDILGPEPLSGYALEGPPEVQARLLEVFRDAEGSAVFDAVLPGNFELSSPSARLARLAGPRGFPLLVANVELEAAHRRHRVIVRRGVALGVTAVVDDELESSIDPLTRPPIDAPARALDESVRALRSAGVDLVVGLVHVRRALGIRRVLQILRAMEQPVPEVVLTSALEGDPEYVRLAGLDTSVVAAPATTRQAALVSLFIGSDDRLQGIDVQRRTPPVVPSAEADAVRNWVCSQLAVPLAPEDGGGPIERDLFVRLVLERMRREAEAEIAIINLGTFGPPTAFPLPEGVTRLDVRRALPFDDALQVAEVKGSALGPLRSLLANPDVAIAGLSRTEVVGRATDPLRTYRVVTVDFLAEGGDRLIDPERFAFASAEGTLSSRQLVADLARRGELGREWLERQGPPRLLDLRVNLGASLKSVNVENRAAAEAPQLTRLDFLGVSGEFELRLVLDLPRHRLEASERTRFGIVREVPEGEAPTTSENEDVTTFELLYAGRLGGGLERPWIPDAGASARLETELTVPDEERGYRRALLSAGVGPSWQLTGNLSLRSQLGLRRELLARADSEDPAEAALAETRVALLSSAELRDEVLANLGPAPSILNLRIDHTVDLTGNVRDQVFQGRIGIDVPVLTGIALTAALDVYVLEREQAQGPNLSGAALDTSFGLRSSTDFSALFY